MKPDLPLRITLEPAKAGSRPLALAMQHWPEVERAAQLESLAALAKDGGGGFLVWAAWNNFDLVGAMLAQQLPGRAATIWPAQLRAEADPEIASQLLSETERHLAAAGVTFCQALLSPDQQPESQQLARAGYHHPANLVYLTCEPGHFPPAAPTFSGFVLRPFEVGNKADLVRLIDETYIGTLDCPQLNGMRDTLDVVEGYQHVGDFRPENWLILESTSPATFRQAAGCLILAEHSAHKTMELMYVGVTPAFRKQGLGMKLTRHAQWLATQAGSQRLVLAVDAANEPAISMYSAAGFWAWDERAIWVKRLSLELG